MEGVIMLKYIGWKNYRNKWQPREIAIDIVVILLLTGVYYAITRG